MQKRERKHIESEIQILIIIYTNRLNHDISNRKIRFKARRKISMQRSMDIDQPIPRFLWIFTKNRFFFFETIHATRKPHNIDSLYYLKEEEKRKISLYYIELTRFNSPPSPRYPSEKWTKRKSENAVRDREGSGGEKNLFPIVPTIFKSQTRGRREEANPSARGVNRDKRRIVLRIQSVTIQQAAYGVREGEGTWRDNTGKRTLGWKQAYLERNKFHDKLEGFRYEPPAFQLFLSVHTACAAFAN